MVWRTSRSAAATLAGLAPIASCTATPLSSSPIPRVEVASPTIGRGEIPLSLPSPSLGVAAGDPTPAVAPPFAPKQASVITRENITGIGRFAMLGGKDYSYIGELAFSPDSGLLAILHAADLENRVTIWDVATGTLLQALSTLARMCRRSPFCRMAHGSPPGPLTGR